MVAPSHRHLAGRVQITPGMMLEVGITHPNLIPCGVGERAQGRVMQAGDIEAQSRGRMAPTDISDPNYFHKVVDCQWACPTHTPVPEYIQLIAHRPYASADIPHWVIHSFTATL